jgi:hypothetical protein
MESYLESGVRLRQVLHKRHAPVEKAQEKFLLEQYKEVLAKKCEWHNRT